MNNNAAFAQGEGAVFAVSSAYSTHAGARVFLGGNFSKVGSLPVNNVAILDVSGSTATWKKLSGPSGADGINGTVYSLHAVPWWDLYYYDTLVAGFAVVAGGDFSTAANGLIVNNIALWKGDGALSPSWFSLDGGLNINVPGSYRGVWGVHATVLSNSGGGSYLSEVLATGQFERQIGFQTSANVARWSGSAWSHVGQGFYRAASEGDGTGSPCITIVNQYNVAYGGTCVTKAGNQTYIGGTGTALIDKNGIEHFFPIQTPGSGCPSYAWMPMIRHNNASGLNTTTAINYTVNIKLESVVAVIPSGSALYVGGRGSLSSGSTVYAFRLLSANTSTPVLEALPLGPGSPDGPVIHVARQNNGRIIFATHSGVYRYIP